MWTFPYRWRILLDVTNEQSRMHTRKGLNSYLILLERFPMGYFSDVKCPHGIAGIWVLFQNRLPLPFHPTELQYRQGSAPHASGCRLVRAA